MSGNGEFVDLKEGVVGREGKIDLILLGLVS